ncbi:MAG: hypothetical protein A2W25_13825 [candidate division Zixibacteria bacterium RBG_16_53_22]|nr:MAG: hypothetical protein A2W25_13825 [candidate division Zixibacteria bacterium RBG_16_53_22]
MNNLFKPYGRDGLAWRTGVDFPDEIKICAVGVSNPHRFAGDLAPSVKKALDRLLKKVEFQLQAWGGK